IRFLSLCLVCVFFVAVAILPPPAFALSRSEGIAAVVNDGAVSETDLAERMSLIIVSSGMPDTSETRDRIQSQILDVLIEEQIKLQEAARLDLTVEDEEVDSAFAALAQSNNFTPEQFVSVLEKEKIAPYTLRDQIKANLAWSKVVQEKLQPAITITDNEVDAMLARLAAGIGKNEYMVSEIFLPVDHPADEPEVKKLAEKLTRELLDQKVPFPKIARQFSQSAGASSGGDMGWIQEGTLSTEIDEVLAKMEEGDLSKPIRSAAGYHIVYLRKKRTITEDSMPSRPGLMHKMGLAELERRARRYMLDLKAAALIDKRI
ncbi:MAG: peptidylprolyl isomerase, partial [Alphaproteobacteria bacterium]|nr:peptidylprolyl isomerase [Alphaproteobacteria bacterium]